MHKNHTRRHKRINHNKTTKYTHIGSGRPENLSLWESISRFFSDLFGGSSQSSNNYNDIRSNF